MNEYDDKWEQQINALLDGELDKTAAEKLKSAATDDRDLARAVIEAYQLQQALEGLPVERAPASLTRRLQAIPLKQRSAQRARWFKPGWAVAVATIPLAIIVLSMMQPDRPSASEIAKARQQLALAFAYIDKAGVITGREIETAVGHTVADVVAGSVNSAFKSQSKSSKEKKA